MASPDDLTNSAHPEKDQSSVAPGAIVGAREAGARPGAEGVAAIRQYFVHGVTHAGKQFRPSDWAERLAGVLAPYRPLAATVGRNARLGYSPYARPMLIGGVKCVVIDERLREIEPMAFEFAINFARDNDLPVYEGCELPDDRGNRS